MRAIGRNGYRLPAAQVDFVFGMCVDCKACRAQHGFDTCAIGNPPIGFVMRIELLNEMHFWVAGLIKVSFGAEIVIRLNRDNLFAASLHALKEEEIFDHVFVNQIKRQERMTQVIHDSHEEDEVEFLAKGGHVPDRHAEKLKIRAFHLSGKASLLEVALIGVDAENPLCSTALHFKAIKTGVAADVEDRLSRDIGERIAYPVELDLRIVAKEMIGSGLDAIDAEIVKPRSQCANAIDQRLVFLWLLRERP